MFNDGHISSLCMQPDPYGQQPQVVIDPMTGMPANVIIMQQPSAAAQVLGIFVIIYGAIGVLGNLLGVFGASLLSEVDDSVFDEYATQMMIFSFVFIAISGMIIFSGVWILQKQTRGVHLAWLTIALSMIITIIQQMIIPAEFSDPTGMGDAIAIVMNVVCSLICGVLVAIPLMVSNSGMDDSSLLPK